MRIGKNKVGIEFIPQDPEGLRLFGEIQKAVAGGV